MCHCQHQFDTRAPLATSAGHPPLGAPEREPFGSVAAAVIGTVSSRRRARSSSVTPGSADNALMEHGPSQAGMDASMTTERDVELLLRENQALRRQVEHESLRARAAEAAVASLRDQMRPRAEDTRDEGARDAKSLHAEIRKLRLELEESRSHIFSLQPYRREITPEEVANDWEDLFASVSDCVERLVGPKLDSELDRQSVICRARKHPTTFAGILKHLYLQPDLSQAALYPDTDLDVLIAIVMRHLNEHIFQTTLYGALPSPVSAIAQIENSMGIHVEPRRDQFAIRSWRAEALGALMADPKYPQLRAQAEHSMAHELAVIFKLFATGEEEQAEAARLFMRECVQPAIRLHEKLQTSTHHFYTTLDCYFACSQGDGRDARESNPPTDLYSALDKLDCENILQNRKTINRAKIDGGSGTDPTDMRQWLRSVLALTPAVYMRKVGQRDTVKEPVLVCKQHMLVAWGSPEKREEYIRTGDQTLLGQLHPPSSRQGGGSVLDIFGGGMTWGFGMPALKRVPAGSSSRET